MRLGMVYFFGASPCPKKGHGVGLYGTPRSLWSLDFFF